VEHLMMKKRLILAGVACLVTVAAAAQAKALMIAPPPTGMRLGSADLVVVGKVTGFGPKMVKSEMFKGDEREMQVALVKVGETLAGKAGKEVKVGFFPPPPRQGGGPRIGRGGMSVQLKQDEESLLFLTKHPTLKDTYMANNYFDAIAKKDNPNFAKEVETVKKTVKLLDKPIDGLKSKDADDRLLTAALLLTRYRTPRTPGAKLEEIPADESKLILEVIANADWSGRAPRGNFMTNPQGLFFQLGLTEKDGWKQPTDFRKLPDDAKKWLKDNAGKYRVKGYVVAEDKAEPKEEKK